MSTNTTVICDGCGKNIQITTHYEREAYLELRNVWKSHTGDLVFGVDLGGAIDSTKHFHDLGCLTKYLLPPAEREYPSRSSRSS